MLKIITVVTGYLEENCYILHNDKDALIIDPGDDSNKIIDAIGNLNVLGILITHYHFDHVGALDDIKSKYNKAKLITYNENSRTIQKFIRPKLYKLINDKIKKFFVTKAKKKIDKYILLAAKLNKLQKALHKPKLTKFIRFG